MTRNPLAFALAAALAAASLACQSGSSTPSAPTGASNLADWWTTGPGGSSLKATPPVAQSPKDNVTVDSLTPTLVVTGGGTKFTPGTVQYRFRVMDNTGALSTDSGLTNAAAWTLPAALTPTTALHVDRAAGIPGSHRPLVDRGRFHDTGRARQ